MSSEILAFRRPPVRQSTVVRAPIARTFAVFTDHLDSWWPLDPFSYGGAARIARVSLDPRAGGAVTEHWHDGTEHVWGTLLRWEPPLGFAMTWNITGQPTEVELTFTARHDDVTEVELEHRGWDKLSNDELKAACALPGGYLGGAFREGWQRILGCFVDAVHHADSKSAE
jgi:hypothetical protein